MVGGDQAAQIADLYSVRMREIARLQQQAAQKEAEWNGQRKQLEKKNVRLEAEKAAAHTSSLQAQALLGKRTV